MNKTKKNNINLHFRRFEFKYHLPRSFADRLIPQMMNYMVWDEYSNDDEGYEVNSLYMDSLEREAYYEKIDGLMNRKKLRVRNYSKKIDQDGDMFFELKRRSGDVILKDRIVVKGRDYNKFIEDPFSLLGVEEYRGDFLNEFLYEFSIRRMKPTVLVSYKRKPFFSKFDKRFRVTFDYDLSFARPQGSNFDADYHLAYHDLVLMEVKFNGAMPKWFHEIIEIYGLTKGIFSKYCAGIESCYGLPAYH